MSKENRWVYSYELQTVTQVVGMNAVYADSHPSEKGKFHLVAFPIYFMGVAKVTRTEYCDVGAGLDLRKVQTLDEGTTIVGLELADGYFEVCNDADNFAGLLRDGEPIHDATGFLSSKYQLASTTEI